MKTTLVLFASLALLTFCNKVHAQKFSWARSCNDSGKASSSKVAVDSWGNTYMVGYFRDTVVFGATTLTAPPGSSGYFLVKYDSSGNVIWTRYGGGVGRNGGSAVSVDAAGKIYVSGYFHTSIILGSTTLTESDTDVASANLFVVKYDTGGTVLWARQSTGYCQVERSNIFADASGNVYVSGQFDDSLSFGATRLFAFSSKSFVVKYNSSGMFQWAKQSLGGAGSSGSLGVCADNYGGVYITGFVQTADSFDTFVLASRGVFDAYLVKYNAAGNAVWAKRAGGSGAAALNAGNAICIDDTGNVYIAGSIQGVADIGPFTLTGSGFPSLFVAKYDTGGHTKWALAPTGANMVSRAYGIAIDNFNNLFVTGEFSGTMSVGPVPSITCDGGVGGAYDAFIAEFYNSGAAAWALSAGGINDDDGNDIAKNGSVMSVTGGFFGSASFGPITLDDPLPSSGISYIANMRDTSMITSGVNNVTPGTQRFSIYPNPASGTLQIKYQPAATPCHYVLYNITGQKMQEGALTPVISISTLPDGQYIMKIMGDNCSQVQKVVVVNR